jgi:hypothetical protein
VAFFVELYLRDLETAQRMAALSRTAPAIESGKVRSMVAHARRAIDDGDATLARRVLRELDELLGEPS